MGGKGSDGEGGCKGKEEPDGAMKLWPFYNISFETGLARDEALHRLHNEIGPERLSVMVGPINAHVGRNAERRMFVGRPLSNGGRFRNNLNSDPGELRKFNAFQATISARINASARGSTVLASLRLSGLVSILWAVWCMPFIWVTLLIASEILHGEDISPLLILAGPAFISFGWLLACFAFSEDAETAERMLRVTLERD